MSTPTASLSATRPYGRIVANAVVGVSVLYALLPLLWLLIASTVLALPLYLLASDLGLANTVWSVLIPVLFNPFGVYLARMFSACGCSPPVT